MERGVAWYPLSVLCTLAWLRRSSFIEERGEPWGGQLQLVHGRRKAPAVGKVKRAAGPVVHAFKARGKGFSPSLHGKRFGARANLG